MMRNFQNISSLINSSILINDHSHPLINCLTKERANQDLVGGAIIALQFLLTIYLLFIALYAIMIYANNA